jgi:hypothetical protein
MALNYKVYIATEGKHAILLKEAFPEAHFLPLSGYKIWYTKNSSFLVLGILVQLPKIMLAAINEYFCLQKWAKQYSFNLIISDNRFGFFHKKIKSVFITHQLELQTPFSWTTRFIQKIIYHQINNFTACWVADMAPENNLSGRISNPDILPKTPIWYMNCLSRFQEEGIVNSVIETPSNSICFLGIVSGPEPQRTILENILWEQGNALGLPFMIVAGLPDQTHHEQKSEQGILHHHLASNALIKAIQNADYIICRGGYTSLMELIPFQKKLILIPTPGQTEQNYLGNYWHSKNWALSFDQKDFNLKNALALASQFEYQQAPFSKLNTVDLENELKRLSL